MVLESRWRRLGAKAAMVLLPALVVSCSTESVKTPGIVLNEGQNAERAGVFGIQSDGEGGLYVRWLVDEGDFGQYVLRVDGDGLPLWAEPTQISPYFDSYIGSGGSGKTGSYYRNLIGFGTTRFECFVVRPDGALETLPCTSATDSVPHLALSGDPEAFYVTSTDRPPDLTRLEKFSSNGDLELQRSSADLLGLERAEQTFAIDRAIAPRKDGGILLAWEACFFGPSDCVRKSILVSVSAAGEPLWSAEHLSPQGSRVDPYQLAEASSSAAYAMVYNQLEGAEKYQLLHATAEDVVATSLPGDWTSYHRPSIWTANEDRAVIYAVHNRNLALQRMAVASNGDVLWGPTEVAFGDVDEEGTMRIRADGQGGILVFTQSQESGALLAQRFDEDGESLWREGGITVVDAVESLRSARLEADGVGGAFVAYATEANGKSARIILVHLLADGTIADE